MVTKNCELAKYLETLIAEHGDKLKLLAPVAMNVVCFRYVPSHRTSKTTHFPEEIDAINNKIVNSLYDQGKVAPSTTKINGVTAIRACFINHRTQKIDIDHLIKSVLFFGSGYDL